MGIIVLGDVEMVLVVFSCSHIAARNSSRSTESFPLAGGDFLGGAKGRSKKPEVMTFLNACDGGMVSAGDDFRDGGG